MRLLPLPLFVLLFLSAAPAAGSDVTVRLDYTRGPGAARCPDEHGVRHFLIGEFGYDPVQPDANATLKISITRVGRTLRVALRLEDSEGNSLWDDGFDEPNCMTLIRHSALKAKINIDYLLREPRTPSPPTAPLSIPAPPAPPPPLPSVAPPPPAPVPRRRPLPKAQSARSPAPPHSEGLRFHVGFDAIGHFGVTPSVSGGGALSAAVFWREYGFGVEGRVASSLSPAEPEDFGVPVPVHSLFAALTLAPCYRRGLFVGCAVVDVGTLRFWHGGIVHTQRPLVVAFGIRPALEIPLAGRFAFHPSVEISTIVTQTKLFRYTREIWHTPRIFGALGLGVTAAFDLPVGRASNPAK